jgi:NAD(P)H-flavin reductase
METAADLSLIDPMAPVPFMVLQRREETHDTFTLSLEPPEPFQFRPGQFNMLYPFGIGESAISISGDPAAPRRLVHTIRRVGNVTAALDRLRPGDVVGVRGPFGNPWPLDDARGGDLVFVAGGIGLAPLRPAIAWAVSHRDDYRRVVVLIGARTPADIVFLEQVQEWRGQFDLEVGVTVDAADQAWRGSVGVVTTLIPGADFEPAEALAMICGPEIMMRFTAAELVKRGVTADRIHVSVERNMKCGIGFCGHCQFGPYFVCRDGPVFRYDRVERLLTVKEV